MFNIKRVLLLAGIALGIPQAMEFIQAPPMPRGQRPRKISRGYHRDRTTLHARNGERECARRRRQIAAGQLRAENGLEV